VIFIAALVVIIVYIILQIYEKCPETMPATRAEHEQSEVLKGLMTIMHHSSRLHEEYLNIGGHSLLCKVLTSSRSVPGVQTLKVKKYEIP